MPSSWVASTAQHPALWLDGGCGWSSVEVDDGFPEVTVQPGFHRSLLLSFCQSNLRRTSFFKACFYTWHIHVCICGFACVFTQGCSCGDQRLALSVFLYHSPPWFGGQGLSLNLELAILARLASEQASERASPLHPLVCTFQG